MKRILLFLTLILFSSLTSCQSHRNQAWKLKTSVHTPEIKQTGLQLGACQAGLTNTKEEYELMDVLGVKWIRSAFFWSRVEPAPGIWDFTFYDRFMKNAARFDKKVLIVLAYDVSWIHKKGEKGRNITREELPAFLAYVKKIAERYGAQAAGFEIWNEPNTPMFWKGSDNDFFELTRRTAELLKKMVPDKPVAVGSIFYHPIMSGKSYLKKMIKNGVLENADAVSLHPYGLSIHSAAKRVKNAYRLIRNSGYNKEIWITEIGVTTAGWYPNQTSVAKQANAVIEAITELSAAGADLICWFKLLNGQMPGKAEKNRSSEEFFGLAYPDFSLKPSGKSYSLLAGELEGSEYIPDGVSLTGMPGNGLESYRFDSKNGISLLILWSKGPKKTITTSGYTTPVTLVNLITGENLVLSPDKPITINSDPVLFTGKLINPSVKLNIH